MRKYSSLILIFLISFLGTLRIPESDLLNYINYFELVGSFNFYEALFFNGKDPIFNLYISFLNKAGLNVSQFIFITSFIFYFIIFKSIKSLKFKEKTKFIFFLFIIFNPLIFSLHLHLMRQFLATTFFIYSLLSQNKVQKISSAFISLGTHFTFIPFNLLRLFLKPSFINNLVIFLIIFSLMFFGENISSFSGFSYLVKKSDLAFKDLGSISISAIFFTFLFISSTVYYLRHNFTIANKEIIKIFNIFSFFLIGSFLVNTELFLRIFPIQLILFHFVAFDYLIKKKLFNKFYPYILTISLILFMSSLFFGRWDYNFNF